MIDNTEDGFSIVDLSSAALVLALPAKVTRRVPKQVVWMDGHNSIAGGSDHGIIYVYDAETARVTGTLQHERDGLVQTVSVRGLPRRAKGVLAHAPFNCRLLTVLAKP